MLLAAVGGPKWDTTDPDEPRPEQGLLGLRKALGLTPTCARSGRSPALLDASPLKRELIEGTDLLVVRELTGGIYFGEKTRTDDRGERRVRATRVAEIERIARVAFGAATRAASRASTRPTCWRRAGCGARSSTASHAEEFPNVELEHLLVDNAAMQLVAAPRHFDVILTENMFGDILSDEAAMITGSIGMLPSASLGDRRPGPVRAGARLGARHRRAGDRQPAGDVPLGRDDAAPRTRLGIARPPP